MLFECVVRDKALLLQQPLYGFYYDNSDFRKMKRNVCMSFKYAAVTGAILLIIKHIKPLCELDFVTFLTNRNSNDYTLILQDMVLQNSNFCCIIPI